MLFITETTLSVPALMGAIMCMGVATANSVLVITFANERFEETQDSYLAALEAGYTRIRPVLMTAGAMIIGMFPMALGLGEGGEQNAPLGRAVIGGLIFATGATLFFVPTVFRLLRRHKPSAAQNAGSRQILKSDESRFDFHGSGQAWASSERRARSDGVRCGRGSSQRTPSHRLVAAADGCRVSCGRGFDRLRFQAGSIQETARNNQRSGSEQFVEIVRPEKVPATVTLNLPGQTEAYTEAPIFAQVNGYLKKWYSDIGAKVKMGDILAEIDTPALDQQLAQAKATLQAVAGRSLGCPRQHTIGRLDLAQQEGHFPTGL